METLFFLVMGMVFSPSKMKTKCSFRRKLITFIKMCTKTQNNRKKRSKRKNTTKSPEIQRSHGKKAASQHYLASFVLQSFCFVSILSLVSALLFWLFGRSQLLLFWKPGFVSLLRVFVKIVYLSFIIMLKLGSSHLN